VMLAVKTQGWTSCISAGVTRIAAPCRVVERVSRRMTQAESQLLEMRDLLGEARLS